MLTPSEQSKQESLINRDKHNTQSSAVRIYGLWVDSHLKVLLLSVNVYCQVVCTRDSAFSDKKKNHQSAPVVWCQLHRHTHTHIYIYIFSGCSWTQPVFSICSRLHTSLRHMLCSSVVLQCVQSVSGCGTAGLSCLQSSHEDKCKENLTQWPWRSCCNWPPFDSRYM